MKKTSRAHTPRSAAAPPCQVCGGLGYVTEDVPVDHPNFGRLLPCVCKLTEMRDGELERLRRLGNMNALARMTFESFRPDGFGLDPTRQANLRIAYEACQGYAAKPDGWLVLFGGYGCGKTHLAAAIANTCIDAGRPALLVVVPDLLDYLRAAYSPASEMSYDKRLDQVQNTPLLILDDLGTHNATEWAGEKLYQILNYRYNAQLPTVVTTNQSLDDLDPRLHSRLADPGLSRIVTILAPDFRLSGASSPDQGVSSLGLFHNLNFDNFHLRERELEPGQRSALRDAYRLAQAYAGQVAQHESALTVGWLLLTGPYGCGKTHLAAAIANYCHERGVPTIFTVVPDLLDYLRKMFAPQNLVPHDKPFDGVRRTMLLVLDDLGTESATPWAKEKLYQIVNYRYNARLPTIVTTAVSPGELDPRISSRLFDRGRCTHVALDGLPSYRIQENGAPPPPSRGQKARGRK
ncbi:MAG: ATP-binding protein [Thermoflexales bacterium]|nr:ATP-binding protein [Thermoflexales bacterium]